MMPDLSAHRLGGGKESYANVNDMANAKGRRRNVLDRSIGFVGIELQ